jgi:Zn finger protein HypA/HybF involved in hydrogenase expression
MGRSIWDFVDGIETRAYLNALFFTCRQTRQPIDVAYRCNWACGSQLYRMEIRSLGKGAIEIAHRALTSVSAAPQSVLVLNDRRPTIQCSQCMRALIGTTWIDVLQPLDGHQFPLRPVVCPSCRQAALAQIAAFPKTPPEEV